jgi:hypothetical protein
VHTDCVAAVTTTLVLQKVHQAKLRFDQRGVILTRDVDSVRGSRSKGYVRIANKCRHEIGGVAAADMRSEV